MKTRTCSFCSALTADQHFVRGLPVCIPCGQAVSLLAGCGWDILGILARRMVWPSIDVRHCKGNLQGVVSHYCGRGNPPPGQNAAGLGNPFAMEKTAPCAITERQRVIVMFADCISDSKGLYKTELQALATRIAATPELTHSLTCWCYPLPCHCGMIKLALLNEFLNRKQLS